MEREIIEGHIDRYTVRIANKKDATIRGTGVLRTDPIRKKACIMTAGHVVCVKDGINYTIPNRLELHLSFGVRDPDVYQKMDVTVCNCRTRQESEEGTVPLYFHRGFQYINGNFYYDAAAFCIPWEEWMDDIPTYSFRKPALAADVYILGFPLSADKEFHAGSGELEGRQNLRASVGTTPTNNTRFSFSYNLMLPIEDVDRNHIMKGYSGSGLFTGDNGQCYLMGIVSQGYGDTGTGLTAWATSSLVLKELLQENHLEEVTEIQLAQYTDFVCETMDEENAQNLLYKIFEELSLTERQFALTHQEKSEKLHLSCKNVPRKCDVYWKGRVALAALLRLLLGETPECWENVSIPLANSDTGKEDSVHAEFLCSEGIGASPLHSIIYKLVKDGGFSRTDGAFQNDTIFLWQTNKDPGVHTSKDRKRCGNIIGNITMPPRERNEKTFNIIDGDRKKASIAVVRIMDLLKGLDEEKICEADAKVILQKELENLWA